MFHYKNIECRQMTDQDIQNTSLLFSENYGIWSSNSSINAGKQIKLSPSRIVNNFVNKPDRYVAMVFDDEKLIGHAFYMRRTVQRSKKITWILQLVVSKDYRGKKIETKLLLNRDKNKQYQGFAPSLASLSAYWWSEEPFLSLPHVCIFFTIQKKCVSL